MKKSDVHTFKEFTEHINFYPSYTVQFNKVRRLKRSAYGYHFIEDHSKRESQREKQPKKFYYDYLSKLTAKKVRRCVEWMYLLSDIKYIPATTTEKGFHFKINFITLTLSSAQMHSDTYINKHLLKPFLTWLERHWNVHNYIWKAEIQDNGNIHYHITTNKYIPKKSIQSKWNSIQNNHGYVKVHPITKEVYNPPSTYIKSVQNEKELGKYIGGYYAKKDEYCKDKQHHRWEEHFYKDELNIIATKYEGAEEVEMKRVLHSRIWSSSESLSRIKCFITEKEQDYFEAKEDYLNYIAEKEIQIDFAKVYLHSITEHTEIHKLIGNKLRAIKQQFNSHDN